MQKPNNIQIYVEMVNREMEYQGRYCKAPSYLEFNKIPYITDCDMCDEGESQTYEVCPYCDSKGYSVEYLTAEEIDAFEQLILEM